MKTLPSQDYMKYWRVIRHFIKVKYGLTQCDLDMILFLRSEGYFSKDKFVEFNAILSWEVGRFERLRQDGWIVVFRKNAGRRKALYELSYKSLRVVDLIYKKLNGEEITELPGKNPMFLKNVSYTDKVYRNFIMEMNKSIKQLRHLSLESQ
jgi:hypothetical protein